ncbi:hypothetical protein NEOLEDRAFT_1055466, partial [Neolentinus lepideus HHB14362 ss-1]
GPFLTFGDSYIHRCCFRTLGKLFTFQLSTGRGHNPYSYVHHPCYTSTILAVVGMILYFMGECSLLREGG